MEITLSLNPQVSLTAGNVSFLSEQAIITPPALSMFDQVLGWLQTQPLPPYDGFNSFKFGIGAAALGIRWGTWLGVLMDETKPIEKPKLARYASGISQGEMKRINLEACANMARLLEMWHQDEFGLYHLLLKAYAYLPMPQRQVKRNRIGQTLRMVMSADQIARRAGLEPFARPDEKVIPLVAEMKRFPYRTLANAIVNAGYRYGPVEAVHEGTNAWKYAFHDRRFTNPEIKRTLKYVSESLSGVFAFPFWEICNLSEDVIWLLYAPDYFPQSWSFTEGASEVKYAP